MDPRTGANSVMRTKHKAVGISSPPEGIGDVRVPQSLPMCRHREASGQDAGHSHAQIISGNRPPASRRFDVVPARASYSSHGSILGCEPGPLRIKSPSIHAPCPPPPPKKKKKNLAHRNRGRGWHVMDWGPRPSLFCPCWGWRVAFQEQVETVRGLSALPA